MPSFKGFLRGKRAQVEEPKKELDLLGALPSTDDFRTSLLMPNLSARFSMLREQDDPTTKIGKASDDSVLHPKRQSRLAEYGGFGGAPRGLADIDEVESIKAPEGVMNRAKPTEGNNLFGGRQKIWKIPQGSSNGIGGRALYDDDVPMSAFQRWRHQERVEREQEQGQEQGEGEASPAEQEEAARESEQGPPDSPPFVGYYNRHRETGSTTSSAEVTGRNSTAATSIMSSGAPSPSGPALERNVTRTRRLYESALHTDVQGQQPSAPARRDTLARQRGLANSPSPSPTAAGFGADRRAVLAKASAPNLRSGGPPALATSSRDLGIAPLAAFGAAPPLSPPISDSGDQVLPIQPNDIGKATAMGVFQKPSRQYDESLYAQRQLQLHQGRDRTESNASFATGRSRSSSSAHRHPFEGTMKPEQVNTPPPVEEELEASTVVPGKEAEKVVAARQPSPQRPSDDDHPAFRVSGEPSPLPSVSINDSEQTSPEDSPTLGPMTTGLSGMVRQHLRCGSNASSIYGAAPHATNLDSRFPVDPLDPDSTSLYESIRPPSSHGSKMPPPTTSVYEPVVHSSQRESRFMVNPFDAESGEAEEASWMSTGQDWAKSFYGDRVAVGLERLEAVADPEVAEPEQVSPTEAKAADDDEDKHDDSFTRKLEDARRRVREKLTSYVESDSSRATSPQPSPMLSPDPSSNLPAPTSTSLGISLGMLKPKLSRGSLIDRSRNMVSGPSKTKKILGVLSNLSRESLALKEEEQARMPIVEETSSAKEPTPEARISSEAENSPEEKLQPAKEEKETSAAHPGLQAFRQARRELQKRKELETLARAQAAQAPRLREEFPDQVPAPTQSPPKTERGPRTRQRTPSRERKPPPVLYRQRGPSEVEYSLNGRSNTSSPAMGMSSASAERERERSGSDTSGGRSSSQTRPIQLPPRNYMGAQDERPRQALPHMTVRTQAPGLPGTDIRRSPYMPPVGHPGRANPGAPSPAPSPQLNAVKSMGNLAVHSGRAGFDPYSGQPSPISPISPMGLPPSPFTMRPDGSPINAPASGNGQRNRRPSAAQSPAFGPTAGNPYGPVKRAVEKRDISEPSFVTSTSRVPTVNLPHMQAPDMGTRGQGYRSRSRSNSGTGSAPAPPLPPINPRRRDASNGMGPGVKAAAMAFIRPVKPEDAEDCKFICRDTLPPSLLASPVAICMAPYLWTLQFTHLFPDNCFVLDDGTGRTVGYVIGVPDVFAFQKAYPRYVAEVLGSEQGRLDVPPPKQLDFIEPWVSLDTGEVNPECLAQTAYKFEWLVLDGVEGKAELVRDYRAVMHINLLEEYRGKGWGRKMIGEFVKSVRKAVAEVEEYDFGKGIQIGVAGENTKVVPFYERVGFRVYPGGEKEGNVWMVMDL
ncbi:hypothetical protein B0H63DRAFT_524642 [Podospora didyma]|uniref:N-acetyltransferase domain-containing protein n=1 Tax=Podospora didyma TaxID=330526 RepID=A0AAE0NI43_9PEZI|nr:hypothetical protein B0H63DRAFT_524642 [Podospora didyma]